MFREWHEWFAPNVEVVAVELPGRGMHRRNPAVDRMETVLERLLIALDPLLDVPFALFGHSLGALIAFEQVRQLRPRGVAPVGDAAGDRSDGRRSWSACNKSSRA